MGVKTLRMNKEHILGLTVKAYNGRPTQPFEERLLSYINKEGKNGCWEWTGSTNTHGYGQIGVNSKLHFAHRISWLIYNSEIPENACVLHKCDNPLCCNPGHLFLGMQADNVRDMVSKGRGKYANGEGCHLSKLTEKQVRLIRYWHSLGNMTQRRIARFFNVTDTNISEIVRRRTWKHI